MTDNQRARGRGADARDAARPGPDRAAALHGPGAAGDVRALQAASCRAARTRPTAGTCSAHCAPTAAPRLVVAERYDGAGTLGGLREGRGKPMIGPDDQPRRGGEGELRLLGSGVPPSGRLVTARQL